MKRPSGKAGAFTLVEVLVVVSILALLLAILLPSLSAATEQARRARCKANLREIARASMAYANDERMHRGKGNVKMQLPSTGWDSGGWANLSASGDVNAGNAGSLGLLAKWRFLSGSVLVCPSAQSGRDRTAPEGFVFSSEELSYSYISMGVEGNKTDTPSRLTHIANQNIGGLILAGDANPATADGTDWSKAKDNSPNHKGKGQNVARMDQSAEWLEGSVVSGDAIYARGDGSEISSSGLRKDEKDVFLLP